MQHERKTSLALQIQFILLLFLLSTSTSAQTIYKVLVAYTDAVESNYGGNILGLVTLAVEETNQAYLNSDIDARVVLSRSVKTGYAGSGNTSTDVNALVAGTDPDIAILHDLRDEYSADVVVLLAEYSNACGQVKTIGVGASEAFAVSDWTCATGNYTFGHEIAHLFGARHNNDPNSTPFAYGHGYLGPSNAWRTIMGVGSTCSWCTRIQHFSNPNINYSGSPTGTSSWNDVARVHDVQVSTVAGFRTPPSNVTLNYPVLNNEYGEVVATNQVQLPTGFSVKGGQLEIRVASSGLTKMATQQLTGQEVLQEDMEPSWRGLPVSYRFTFQQLEVGISMEASSLVRAEVFDLRGRRIGVRERRLERGRQQLYLPGEWFQGGGRIVRLTNDHGTRLSQKVVTGFLR